MLGEAYIRRSFVIVFVALFCACNGVDAQQTGAGKNPDGNLKQLTVLCPVGSPPLAFRDEDDRPLGVLADYWREWSRTTGVAVAMETANLETCIRRARQEPSVVIGGIFYTPDRDRILDFSGPLDEVEVALYLHRDSASDREDALQDLTISVPRGGAGDDLRPFVPDSFRQIHRDTRQQCVQSVLDGEAHGVVMEVPCATQITRDLAVEDILQQAQTVRILNLCAATGEGNSSVLSVVDDGIVRLDQRRLAEVREGWLAPAHWLPAWLRRSMPWLLAGGLIVLLAGSVLGLRIRVAQRTRELQRSRERLSNLMAHVPGMIYRCRNDECWTMEFVSEGCRRLTGYDREDLEQNRRVRFADIIHEEDREEVRRAVQEGVQSGTTYRVTYRIITADGEPKWVWEQGRVLQEDGDESYLEGLILDVDHRIRAEQRIQETMRKLAQSNAELEQFAYVASHDLREPLRAIEGYLDLLERRYGEGLTAEGQEFLHFARDGSERLQKMIDDLLAYSRVDSEAHRPEPTDVREVVESVRRSMSAVIQEAGADVQLGALPTVMSDPTQLERVIQNLLSNALKYRGEAKPVVRIEAERENGMWRISVCDNGVGLPPEQRDRVFRIFQRAHSRSEYEGTGMGLAICRKIVARHGGRMWAEDSPLGGTCFCFTMPALPQDEDAAQNV